MKPDADPSRDAAGNLSRIVQEEAYRALSEAQLQPDPTLVAQGWERRFMGDAARVREAVELYESMDFEVLTVPVQPAELADECDGCRLVVAFHFQTVYTRRSRTTAGPDEEGT